MKPLYSETRISILLCVFFLALAVFGAFTGWYYYEVAGAVIFTLVVLAAFLVCFTFSVAVDGEAVYTKFGVGLFSKEIPFQTIQTAELADTGVLGWLYAPGRKQVLRLKLREGSVCTVVAEEPWRIREIIISRQRS